MSDLSIPGVTASKYKTDELIEALMRVERLPRDRAEAELETFRSQQSAWRQINQLSTTLRDTSRSMYSYNNPFNEKRASSTNERAIDATATRDAREQSFRVSVAQIAQADSFLSAEISRDGRVSGGEYIFSVGDKSVRFNWKGGTWREFSDAINRRSEGLIHTSIIQTSPGKQAVLFESLKTGSDQRLRFDGAALDLALEAGIIKKNDSTVVEVIPPTLSTPAQTNNIASFSEIARASQNLVLEMTVSVKNREASSSAQPQNRGVQLEAPGSLTFQGVTIQNAPSETGPGLQRPQAIQTPVENLNVLSVRTSRGIAIPLDALTDTPDNQSLSIPLSEFGDVDALLVNNKNTAKDIIIENMSIIDPRAAGEYTPVNPVSTAQDAHLSFEGIRITRKTNTIDDLVPGVTLNLHEQTTKSETISITPNTETVKEHVIELVARYNRVLAEINILTQNKPEIISEIQYFTPEERAEAEKKLGMMQGDTTLNTIKNNLQRIVTSVYQTGESNSIRMLSDIGISSKATAGAGIDASRLRGYLEINEKQLDEVLKNRMEEVKTLFGFDTDADLIIDSGVGYALDTAVNPYVQTGGIFANRTSGLDTRITNSEKRITQLDVQLASKEADLRRKYGQMEGTLNSLQNQSNSISNFNRQNSN